MFAVTVVDSEDGGVVEWREHPDPVPGTGELLVAVKAAGLNSGDLMQRAGVYPAPPGSPADIPGLEMAGEVVAVGPGVLRYAVGDRVMAVVGGGGQGELCVVHERCALPVPPGVSWAEAGGFPEAFTTAHDAVFTQCELGMGERLVVHGAAGGVGVAGVQLGAAAGAAVVATVRNESLRASVAALAGGATARGASGAGSGGSGASGAEGAGPSGSIEVVGPEGFGAHGPFDVVLELIGGSNLAEDLSSLAIGGRIAIIGVGYGGAKAEINLLGLMAKRGRIHGSTLRPRPLEAKAAAAQAVEHHVLPLLASGAVSVPVCATFPMSDPTAAYDAFAAGKFGKLVLVNW